jgi:hypothetical protein
VCADGGKVDHARMALGAIADDVGLGGEEVEAERHVAHRLWRAAADAELQQAIARTREDGEGARGYLGVEFPGIAGWHTIEGAGAIRDRADEDIDTAGGALGVGGGGDVFRQAQAFLQRDEIDATGFQNGAAREIERVHDEAVVEPVGDHGLAGQEAGAQAIGDLAQAQVEACGLDLVRLHPAIGEDSAGGDDRLQLAVGHDSGRERRLRHLFGAGLGGLLAGG